MRPYKVGACTAPAFWSIDDAWPEGLLLLLSPLNLPLPLPAHLLILPLPPLLMRLPLHRSQTLCCILNP